MKAFVIIEQDFREDRYDWAILGVVETEEEARKIVEELTGTVKEYNESTQGNKILYCYDDFELGDMSSIETHIKYNLQGRKG